MEITSALVKELRERTGAGMMDCKKALMECAGEMEKAIDFLREKGLAAAAKKAGRIAAEGVVDAYVDHASNTGVLVEVNCETDFVAKTDNFKAFARDIAEHIAEAKPQYVTREDALVVTNDEGKIKQICLMEQVFVKDASKTKVVNDLLGEATASIGEKISVRRFARYEGNTGMVDAYIHMGGRIGVLVELNCDSDKVAKSDDFKTLVHDIAMHIAAANPLHVQRAEVPTESLDKEREVLRAQALNEGKPEKIVDKMVEGRIEKYYKEVCLMEQPYVKDPDKSIKDLVAEEAKKHGENIVIRRFARFERGEGMEKRQDNFAEEVAAQMGL